MTFVQSFHIAERHEMPEIAALWDCPLWLGRCAWVSPRDRAMLKSVNVSTCWLICKVNSTNRCLESCALSVTLHLYSALIYTSISAL